MVLATLRGQLFPSEALLPVPRVLLVSQVSRVLPELLVSWVLLVSQVSRVLRVSQVIMGVAGVAGVSGAAGVSGVTGVAGISSITGVAGVAAGVLGAAGVWVLQLSLMPLVEGEAPRSRLGVMALASGQSGAVVGLVVFSCESWVVSCLEWSPTGIARPVGGWMPQSLDAGVLSC